MSLEKEDIYYSFIKGDYYKTKETFIAPLTYDWSSYIEINYQTIYNEVIIHLNENEKHFFPYFSEDLVNTKGKWKSFGFYFWGLRADDSICDSFPKTIKILKTIPGIISASVSIMESDSEIKPHYGDTNAIHRCHLGLLIPASLPLTGFQVGYEKRCWEEGKLLIFNDGAYHKAWNQSPHRRIVLIFDVIRPQYMNQKFWICARVNSIILSQSLIQKNPYFFSFFKFRFPQYCLVVIVALYIKIFKSRRLWL